MTTWSHFLTDITTEVRERAPIAVRMAVWGAAVLTLLLCTLTGRW